ncbi:putative inactive receptor kinase [Sesamum alatum]|uniref:Inactive receptor kinase n=1 Tax=Sesamum alatum TaxID=300844 RepID=A0AAE1XXF1_9LAMI|nr:putative inactive receptor kinase [Sesamum alatum]
MSCHGTLYKAVLSSGHVLAVKLLKEGIAKGRKEFAREAKKLGNIRHPNLVSLQGFYWGPKEHEKLIISKYINAPCLALYLHVLCSNLRLLSLVRLSLGTDNERSLICLFADRLKVALDVACCLTYLHTESAIPHGNLKSTNILIEVPNINVLLTDYSLHRLLDISRDSEQVAECVSCYLPPEFTSTTDIVPGNPEVVDLSEWVSLMAAENRAVECFDFADFRPQKQREPFQRVLIHASDCSLKCILRPRERPDMKMILE